MQKHQTHRSRSFCRKIRNRFLEILIRFNEMRENPAIKSLHREKSTKTKIKNGIIKFLLK